MSKNGQILSVPRVGVTPGSLPFLLGYTFLPPTISDQAPSFSSADDEVVIIDATTGEITMTPGVMVRDEVTITVRRGGGSTYSSVVGILVLQVMAPRHPFSQVVGTVGSEETPYEISTIGHLNAIREEYLDDHFLLTTDLDFSGHTYDDPEQGWLPMGHDTVVGVSFQGTGFTGSFDGAGHVIGNLRIDRGGESFVGLFGRVDGGSIVSLGLEDLEVTGDWYVGGLVGRNQGGTVTASYATGSVMGNENVGGLMGRNQGGTVTTSYATGSVMGNWEVGGLVGQHDNGTVTASYATGSVTGVERVGGLVGWVRDSSTVTASYATGSVTGDTAVGGLVGLLGGGVHGDGQLLEYGVVGTDRCVRRDRPHHRLDVRSGQFCGF